MNFNKRNGMQCTISAVCSNNNIHKHIHVRMHACIHSRLPMHSYDFRKVCTVHVSCIVHCDWHIVFGMFGGKMLSIRIHKMHSVKCSVKIIMQWNLRLLYILIYTYTVTAACVYLSLYFRSHWIFLIVSFFFFFFCSFSSVRMLFRCKAIFSSIIATGFSSLVCHLPPVFVRLTVLLRAHTTIYSQINVTACICMKLFVASHISLSSCTVLLLYLLNTNYKLLLQSKLN